MADRVETIGIYSAYGFAKEAGYTGTKAEFEQGLKNSAEYADNAASSANAATNAKNAAVTAKTDAQAAQSAAETAQGLAEDAQAAAEEAKNDAEAAAASLDASTIARIDGYYTNLAAGTADQLMATQKVHNTDPYIFRTSGGSSDIGDREELEIVGGSIDWNQLVRNGNFANGATYWDSGQYEKSASDNILTVTIPAEPAYHLFVKQNVVPGVANHKYLFSAKIKSSFGIEQFNFRIGTETILTSSEALTADTWMTFTSVVSTPSTINPNTPFTLYCTKPRLLEGTIQFAEIQCFDLTQMFGSEIADYIYGLEQAEAGAGVAWFRKFFPNDYYDYDEGELLSVSDLQSHDTVGFNLWDEEWEVGGLSSGSNASNPDRIRSKNYNRIFPDTDYYACVPNTYTGNIWFSYYDENKKYIKGTNSAGSSIIVKNGIFRTPNNAHYFRFQITNTTRYNNDICINLSWSGGRNGEYEPYVKRSYPLDSSLTLRGIPKLDANNNLYFDGDTYEPDGTVTRRYGIVDLGTLTWRYIQGANANYFSAAYHTIALGTLNLLCLYPYKVVNNANVTSGNRRIAVSAVGSTSPTLYIRDDSYSDAETFKAAMSGVYLVYELAEPTTEEAASYTSPQLVDDWGTEEFVTSSIVPVGHNTYYPANLRDKLQHLPDLPDTDGYYMTQVDGTQMSLVRFRIPQAPAEDGEYVLKATVSGGTPTYTWEAVVEAEGGEG